MAQPFTMPKFGMTMEEGRIVRWIKNPGDTFKKGETLLEVETDKSVIDVEANTDGRLVEILAQVDQTVACGLPIATIE